MSRNVLLAVLLIAVAFAAAVGIFTLTPRAAVGDAYAGGRYSMVANDQTFVLYDRDDSSKTWILFPKPSGKRHAWLPIKRLDTESEIQSWKLIDSSRQ